MNFLTLELENIPYTKFFSVNFVAFSSAYKLFQNILFCYILLLVDYIENKKSFEDSKKYL